jgi:tetratricopeptide (TPR) repeat protein
MSLEHAESLLDLGRAQEALDALSALGDDGLSGRAHCLRSLAYLRLGRPVDAERCASHARIAAPQEEWGYRLGAIAALRQGAMAVALPLAESAVRLEPQEALTHQVLATVLLRAGDVARADVHAQEMVQLAPDMAMSHVLLSRVFLGKGLVGEAETSVRRALALEPLDDEALALLADIAAALGRDDEALQLRVDAVRSDPQSSHHRQNLLKRGGAAAGGGFFVIGKLGFAGKLLALSSVTHVFRGGPVRPVLAVLFTVVYSLAFLVSRRRRAKAGRDLPPGFWEGLAAERRNADLLWLSVPAAIFVVVFGVAGLEQLANGQNVTWSLTLVALSAAVLVGCWKLRRGDAQQLRLRDLLQFGGYSRRLLLQNWQLRRGPLPGACLLASGTPLMHERKGHARPAVLIPLVLGAVLGAVTSSWLVAGVIPLVGAGLWGVLLDGRLGAWRSTNDRTLLVDARSGLPVPVARRAGRAVLRLLVSPALFLQCRWTPHSTADGLHDRLTGSRLLGLVSFPGPVLGSLPYQPLEDQRA